MTTRNFGKWLAAILGEHEFEVHRLLGDDTALHFLIAWSLFESKCFKGFLKARDLGSFAEHIVNKGFPVADVRAIADHFHQRFQGKRELANLLQDDKTPEDVATQFKNCLARPFAELRRAEIVFLASFVIYRYRKGVASWLSYREQIGRCTEVMQAFVSHAEAILPTMSTRAAA
jgi:hypothetical protein